MAEDPKIVPSPPPAEPVDVRVSPSPAPSEPFDVPTYPSPPPAQPIDVQTYPDPPPGGTVDVPVSPTPPPGGVVDVPTSPDPGPREPVDVPTNPDGPPAEPFDVPTPPDPGPRTPVDVPTSPDGPPAEPFNVPTAPDGPPVEPVDVPTALSGPPATPFDVPVAPDGPPVDPVDVPITLDPAIVVGTDGRALLPDGFDVAIEPDQQLKPDHLWVGPTPAVGDADNAQIDKNLFEPAEVRDNRDPGVPGLLYPLSSRPTTRQIINAVKEFDGALANFLSSLDGDQSRFSVSIGAGALDPVALVEWFRNYLNTVGPGGLGRFMAEQAALHAMNPVAARVFNPGYFQFMLIPGSMGNFHATLDTQAGVNAKTVAEARDVLLQAEVVISGRPGDTELNLYGPGSTMIDGQEFSIDEMVDSVIDDDPHHFMATAGTRGIPSDGTGIPLKRFDANAYFNTRDSFGGQAAGLRARTRVGIENVQSREAVLAASTFINGVVRVPVSTKEDPDGAVYTQDQNPSPFIDDDEARVPLCFTDLRKTSRGYRSIYFRPLNLSFNESIGPEWQEGMAFGRVDPIVAYQRTTRTFSVSFEAHAFAPEDMEVMYAKMNWLKSMCYPSYSEDSLMRSGPVSRMRIGDVVSTESGGLPGVIKSLSIDFADALWELKKGMKVPMSFKVQLEFLALHEGPVGTMNDQFGVFKLPVGNNTHEETTYGGVKIQVPNEGPPPVATFLPGRFAKFGEPKKR